MRIRFFNTYEPVAPLYRDLLPALAQYGLQVEVYISAAEYRPHRIPLAKALHHPNIRIRHFPSMGLSPTGRPQKVWLMLIYALFAAARSLVSTTVDINCFLTQPPLFSLWGWFLKTLRGQRYYCLIMDLYPDVAVQNGSLPEHGLVTRVLKTLTRLAWKHADGIVVIGRCQRDRLVQEGVAAEKIHFIPNWANKAKVHPVPSIQNALRRKLGLTEAFVVLYSGNMGICHDFQTLLGAAQRLLPYLNIKFVLIGDGAKRAELEKEVITHNLKNVIFLPFQPVEHLAESLSLGDVHIVTLRNGFEGLVVPSKAYSALATGRPLIYVGHPDGEIGRMVHEFEIGMVIPVGNQDELAQSILMYSEKPGLRKRHGQKALWLSKNRYHYMNSILSYQKLFMR